MPARANPGQGRGNGHHRGPGGAEEQGLNGGIAQLAEEDVARPGSKEVEMDGHPADNLVDGAREGEGEDVGEVAQRLEQDGRDSLVHLRYGREGRGHRPSGGYLGADQGRHGGLWRDGVKAVVTFDDDDGRLGGKGEGNLLPRGVRERSRAEAPYYG